MGIYGMGKANNYQYVRRQVNLAPRTRAQQPFTLGQGFQQTTTIEYNNGPGGFWGTLAGLINGFGGNSFGCNGFGFGNFGFNNNFNSGFGGGGGKSQGNVNCLENLKTMGPGWSIVQNPDGSFTGKKGNTTFENLDYDTAMNRIMNSNANEPEGEPSVTPGANPTTPGANPTTPGANPTTPGANPTTPGANPTTPGANPAADPAANPGANPASNTGWSNAEPSDLANVTNMTVHDASGKTKDISGKFSITKPADTEGGFPKEIKVGAHTYQLVDGTSNPAKYKSVGDSNNNEYRLEKNANGSFALNQYEGDSGYGVADRGATSAANASSAAGGTGAAAGGKVKVPVNWGKAPAAGIDLLNAGLKSGKIKNISDLVKWLKTTQKGTTIIQADLIKYNPSIFKSTTPGTPGYGEIKPDADFRNLDIPNGYSAMIPAD